VSVVVATSSPASARRRRVGDHQRDPEGRVQHGSPASERPICITRIRRALAVGIGRDPRDVADAGSRHLELRSGRRAPPAPRADESG